jgi:hypothetical protein
MPNKHGQGTYKGYISPVTTSWPGEIREEVRKVYGAYRVNHPGEDHATKSRGARIAWAAAKRKYPDLYRKHVSQVKRGERIEHKEHPEFSKKIARQIATDHIVKNQDEYMIETPNFHIKPVTPAKTKEGRKKQVHDLREAADEQRRWAGEAGREAIAEEKRSKNFKKEGMPLRSKVLKDDANLAEGFRKDRMKVAHDLDMQAARIAAMED